MGERDRARDSVGVSSMSVLPSLTFARPLSTELAPADDIGRSPGRTNGALGIVDGVGVEGLAVGSGVVRALITGVLLPFGGFIPVRDGPAVIAGDRTLGVTAPLAGVAGVDRLFSDGENGRAVDDVAADTRDTSDVDDGVERRGGRVGGVATADGSTLALALGCVVDDEEGVEVDAEWVICVATWCSARSRSRPAASHPSFWRVGHFGALWNAICTLRGGAWMTWTSVL